MRRSLLTPAAALAILSTGITQSNAVSSPNAIGAEPVATGLDFPAAFTITPDGRIFWGTAFGAEVHLYDPGTGSDSLFYPFPGAVFNDGILGLVLSPGYPTTPFVYVYITRKVAGLLKTQIVRLRDVGGTGTDPKVIYNVDAGTDHRGGRMQFGTDGMLFVMTGEAGDPANSQDLASTQGKMLRMTPAGQPAPGNPFGTLVWAYGVRNSLGWDFDAQTGFLWEADNGPECNDEINLIRKGRNYGWGPSATCSTPPPPPRNTNQDGPNPILPVRWIADPTAPTGLAFCEGCGLSGAEGTMFYGNVNTWQIHQVVLTANRRGIVSDTNVYMHLSLVLSIERGPDAALYFSDDTAIYRLVDA